MAGDGYGLWKLYRYYWPDGTPLYTGRTRRPVWMRAAEHRARAAWWADHDPALTTVEVLGWMNSAEANTIELAAIAAGTRANIVGNGGRGRRYRPPPPKGWSPVQPGDRFLDRAVRWGYIPATGAVITVVVACTYYANR